MANNEVTDMVLVQKAQHGDQPAYEALIRRYDRLIWANVYGIIRDPAWTEDLVQETFLKGWQSLRQLREPAKFRGWLIMIARRKGLEHNERLSRKDQVMDELASLPAAEADTDAEDLRQQLHTALTLLPERYRLPLTLRYLDGMDYYQIAGILAVTDGSLRGLLNRGMKMLKEKVKPQTCLPQAGCTD